MVLNLRRALTIFLLLFASTFGLPEQGDSDDRPAPGAKSSHKCGLPLFSAALAEQDTAALRAMAVLDNASLKQTSDSLMSPSGHFRIIYDPVGIPGYDRDANNMPDYLEFVAKSFDRAWEIEIDSLGFQPPLDINGNTRTTYDVYCKPLGPGLYGQTYWDLGTDIISRPGFNYVTDIDINTNFSFVNYPDITSDPIVRDSLAIAVTAAHEFNHALQISYRVWQENDNINGGLLDLWFFESSATYMEEVVAGEVNDYLQYLDNWFATHDRNITVSTGLRIYGQSIFFLMLQEDFGQTITRDIWEAVQQQRPLEATRTVLQNKGSSFSNEWRRLATWMYFTGGRTVSGQFFPEAGFYPEIEVELTDPFTGGESGLTVSGQLSPLAFNYFRTPLNMSTETSLALIPGGNEGEWNGAYFTGNVRRFRDFPSGLPRSTRDLVDRSMIDYVIVSGAWGDLASTGSAFYEVEFTETPLSAAPNIVRPGDGVDVVRFLNTPSDAVVQIFNANGQRIATVKNENGSIPSWDLLNVRGEPVGSGVYIYQVISGESEFDPGKIVIIR